MVDYPTTGKGALIVAASLVVVLVALYTTGLLPVLIGAAVVALIAYALYVVAIRIHRRAVRGSIRGRGGEE